MLRDTFFTIILLGLIAAPAIASDAPDVPAPVKMTEVIDIDTGQIQGHFVEGPSARVYKGIPFAAPPVGDLRWKPPQPAASWDGVRECTEFGSVAPQTSQPFMESYPGWAMGAEQNEDCLYLNVWTPEGASDAPLPVMVWIHGGGYTIGSGSQGLYDGRYLVQQGVILVTTNYRLGALGFLAHEALNDESENGTSGNYGILDQIAALEWVQRNIAAFGGDPDRVTIFGESAGGGSVWSLLVSPLAEGLFDGAIAQSPATLYMKHLADSQYGFRSMEEVGEDFGLAIGVNDHADPLETMRAASVEAILAASPRGEGGDGGIHLNNDGMVYAPIVDGWVIPDDPITMLENNKQNQVPLIVGTNKDEGTMFTVFSPTPQDAAGYQALLDRDFGDAAPSVLAAYPADDPASIKAAVRDLFTDTVFKAPARIAASLVAEGGNDAYLYFFGHRPPSSAGAMLGSHHGGEILYTFDNMALFPKSTEEDASLGKAMSGYWTNFAKTGNPNSDGMQEWPAYAAASDQHLEFASDPEAGSGLGKARVDAIEAFVHTWRAD